MTEIMKTEKPEKQEKIDKIHIRKQVKKRNKKILQILNNFELIK
jgi:hypothetical protein